MDRERREVEESTEHTVGASFDLNPPDWLLLRGSYKHSRREPEEYEENEYSLPDGEGPERNAAGALFAFALPQIPSARKFDHAARGRHRAEALLQLTPADQFSFAASYDTTQDSYQEKGCIWPGYDQCNSLLKDISYNYAFELTYTPHPAVSFVAEYTREKYKYRQLARQRLPARAPAFGGAPANNSPNNDWETHRRDLVDMWAAGLDASFRDKVIFSAFYTLSAAKSSIFTKALGDPSLPGFLVTTGVDYPDASNRWHQLITSYRFPLKGWFAPRLEYRL